MSDLIDRQALKDYVSSLSTHPLNEWDTWGVLAAIDHIPTASPWHMVEEELPKETKLVVTYGKGHVSFGYYLLLYDADTDKEVVEWFDYCGNRENVTHWMLLPEPPKEDK